MAGQILRFSFTPEKAEDRMRALSISSIGWDKATCARMRQRKLSSPQIVHAIAKGRVVEGPDQGQDGNWTCRFQASFVGRNVEVTVRMIKHKVLIVTADTF